MNDGPGLSGAGSGGRNIVWMAAIFYGLMCGIAFVTDIAAPGIFGFRILPDSSAVLFRDVLVGLCCAFATIAGSWLLVSKTASGRRLAVMLAGSLRGTSIVSGTALAMMAGFSEEVLFRGACWSALEAVGGPLVALAVSSVLFAAAHGAFRRGFVLWGLFALWGGLIAGLLRMATGTVASAIVMHVVVDAVNIPLILKRFSACDGE